MPSMDYYINSFCTVLNDFNALPRYQYHRSLLDWCIDGLPRDQIFQGCLFRDTSVILGGNINDKDTLKLFGDSTVGEYLIFKCLNVYTYKQVAVL